MVNKNDLRYIKTDDLIRSTYLTCRKEGMKNLNVTTLCRLARINKSTFYVHYESLEQLHRQLCAQTIRELMQALPHLQDLFTDTDDFVHSVGSLFQESIPQRSYLFPDWTDTMDYIEEVVLDLYIREDTPVSLEAAIRFSIGGTLRLLSASNDRDTADQAVKLIKRTLEGIE